MDLIFNEKTQMWEERKAPFATIEVETEKDFNRIKELWEADREGRCVVLPHMIGDTLISGLAKTPINAKPNERANQAQELEELYTRLYAVTGFTAAKLLEMFAAGYMLKKPDYSKLREEMANLAETTTPNELPKRH